MGLPLFFDAKELEARVNAGSLSIGVDSSQSKKPKKSGFRDSGPNPKYAPPTIMPNSRCGDCGLSEGCGNAVMDCHCGVGPSQGQILVVMEAPSNLDDRLGKWLSDASGEVIITALEKFGVDYEKQIWVTGAVQCCPPKQRKPTPNEVKACYGRLASQIQHLQPGLILCFGSVASEIVLQPPFTFNMTNHSNILWPSHIWNSWVGCVPHPNYVISGQMKEWDFRNALKRILVAFMRAPEQLPTLKATAETLDSGSKFMAVVENLEQMSWDENASVNFDFETTGLYPREPGADIISVALAWQKHTGVYVDFRTIAQPDLAREALVRFIASPAIPKSIQNAKFEADWAYWKLGVELQNFRLDTLVAGHVEDERVGNGNLAFQSFRHFGTQHKSGVDRANISNMDPQRLAEYNVSDAVASWRIADHQMNRTEVPTRCAINFFNKCLPVMMRASRIGVKVDRGRLQGLRKELAVIEAEQKAAIASIRSVRDFSSQNGNNYLNEHWVAKFLYEYHGVSVDKRTDNGKPSTDIEALEAIAHPIIDEDEGAYENVGANEVTQFCEALMKLKKITKMQSTYLDGYESLMDADGLIHPDFNLHTTATFRSSSTNPNFQNIPKRDKFQQRVREVFVPHIGSKFLEADYEAAEIKVLAMYSQCPTLVRYIKEGYDMHRAWASRLLEKLESEVTKAERSAMKSAWVFALFYGSWWKSCKANLQKAGFCLDKPDFFFENMERALKQEFSGVFQWQERLEHKYKNQGYVETFLGFRRHAPLTRNKIINSPIQGTSFHMMLDACRLIDEYLISHKMKTRIVAQIHDSIFLDVVESECDDVVELVKAKMCERRWQWEGDVAMKCELEMGDDWTKMKKVE